MKAEFYVKNRKLVIMVGNELDHHNAERIRTTTEEYLCRDNIRNLIFDFQKTDFMDSSGIGILIGRYKVLSRIGGSVSVVNVNKNIERVFLISGIYKLIRRFDSVDQALRQEV